MRVCPPTGENGTVYVGGHLLNTRLESMLDQLTHAISEARSRAEELESQIAAFRNQFCAFGGPGACHAKATCTPDKTCVCNAGFTGNGTFCGDINECSGGNGGCAQVCTNTDGSFVCSCNAGYTGAVTCTNTNECVIGAHSCDPVSAICTDTTGSFLCSCKSGWIGNGTRCADLDECSARTHSCSVNGTCTNTAGSFTCACADGFNDNGTACNPYSRLWVQQFGSSNNDDGVEVAVDELGRVFVAGCARKTTFPDHFVSQRNGSSGLKVWEEDIGVLGSFECSYALATYRGAVFVAGRTDANAGDMELLILNATNGTVRSRTTLGSSAGDVGHSLAVNRSSAARTDVYVCGTTQGNLPTAKSLGGTYDAFLVRYSTNISVINTMWILQFGTASIDDCFGVAVFGKDVYVTGTTTGIYGNASVGKIDAFIAKITTEGVVVWKRQLGSNADDVARAIAVDESGIFITGSTTGSIGGLTNRGLQDVFLAKYSHAGDLLWTKMLGTVSDEDATSIALDRDGNILIAGFTAGNLFPPSSNSGGSDAFFAQFNSSSGALKWGRLIGSSGTDTAHSVAADLRDGSIYVGGDTSGTIGEAKIGQTDLFLAKFR